MCFGRGKKDFDVVDSVTYCSLNLSDGVGGGTEVIPLSLLDR